MTKQKILMIIAPEGFRDEEYFDTRAVFEENGFEVDVCSKNVEVAIGKFGQEVDIDIDLNKVDVNNYQAIVFVGGPGALDYVDDETVLKIINDALQDSKRVLGAICIAPMILLAAGVLEGKSATVWDKDKKQSEMFKEAGVTYVNEPVFEDGNIVTASGPEASSCFAETILEKIEELAD